jgi:hypothetical protein
MLLKGSNEPAEWWKCRFAVFNGMIAFAQPPRARL